jgi:hypothetical protein
MEVHVDIDVDDEQSLTSREQGASGAGSINKEKRIIIVREEDNSNQE